MSTSTNTIILEIKNACLSYAGKQVFSDISLNLAEGEWVSLLGSSGIGKSSLLRMIAGLTTPQETATGYISPVQQQIAYMAQTDLLLPWLSVIDNVLLGFRLRRHTPTEFSSAIERASSLLHEVGLSNATNLYPHQLSGGMRQRAALVRTLMEDKPIILMDEPFSALDTVTRYRLQDLAMNLLEDKTVLFITHDPAEALRLADTIYIMAGQPVTLRQIANSHSNLMDELMQAAGDAA